MRLHSPWRSLPDEIWRQILTLAISNNTLDYRDICSLSISSRQLSLLSSENTFWFLLLSSDFPGSHSIPPTEILNTSSFKLKYKSRFQGDKRRILWARRLKIMMIESHISLISRRLKDAKQRRRNEMLKLKSTSLELSTLKRARCVSVDLKLWQPKVAWNAQKQLVEQCPVSVECHMKALEMEVTLCQKVLSGIKDAARCDRERLIEAIDQLASFTYHPIHSKQLNSPRYPDLHTNSL